MEQVDSMFPITRTGAHDKQLTLRSIGDVYADEGPEHYAMGMKLNFISQGLLMWGLCVVKLSVGCALLRIAVQKRWRYTILGIMIFMTIYTIGCFTVSPPSFHSLRLNNERTNRLIQTLFTQCDNVASQWNFSIPRNCWSAHTLQALAFTHAALNIITDFVFAVIIPIPMLWGLKMNKRTKAAVMVMLSLGLFVCLAGILRLPTIANYGKAGDLLWDSRDLSIWFVAEFNTGIVAGSMPALKPLFKTIFESTYLKSRSQGYGYANNSGTGPSQQRSYPSKGFNTLHNKERIPTHDQFDDGDGSASQRGLVTDTKPIALGVIRKDITTTVTPVDSTHNVRGNVWNV
jgi:hypothetical protein